MKMNRAAVLIGVRKTDDLPQLQAVLSGVTMIENWLQHQEISQENIKKLTDESSPVHARDIFNAINDFVKSSTIDQLIIYFSGHGLNLGQSEYWLLSGFPNNPNEVVNLASSVELARVCNIPHVVFISDACRNAAASIHQHSALEGATVVFPNKSSSGPFRSVDVFYATLLGRPALEILDQSDQSGRFRTIYTETLVDALNGIPNSLIEFDNQIGQRVIRPWPLKKHLSRELPLRLVKLSPQKPLNQQPDAVLSSDPDLAWLSIVKQPQPQIIPTAPVSGDKNLISNFQELSQDKLRSALSLIDTDDFMTMPVLDPIESTETHSFNETFNSTLPPFGPVNFETMCGIKVRNLAVSEVFSNHSDLELINGNCQVSLRDRRFANVLLTVENGWSVLLPALEGFITGLTFQNDELVEVSYEPSENSPRWDEFLRQHKKIRSLRSIVASSTRSGTFQLEGDDADKIARSMQLEKGIDPSLGVYAAYAYRRQGQQDWLNQMTNFMRNDLSIVLFDIAMLDGELTNEITSTNKSIAPDLPLLTQGWALLNAFNIQFPSTLKDLRNHVNYNSLWTIYNKSGATLLKHHLQSTGA